MTTKQKDRIIALRNSGRSYAEIAQELDYSLFPHERQ